MHNKESSDIAEHCIVYSMSDGEDTDYRKKCGHRHDIICENCHVLVSTLADIQTKATTANFPTIDDRDEVAYMVNSSKTCDRVMAMSYYKVCKSRPGTN